MTDELLAERYQRLRPLGSGSMSVVWLADDLLLGREVAIKKMRTDLAAGLDSAAIERMSREARVAARLNHPHAVGVYDLVTEDAQPYLVMEFVAGESLAEKIRREGRVEPAEAARLIGQVAGALEAAHRVGIVHRDIKPANIILDADGNAKLADFGIARSNQDAALTDAGQMIGTVAYMAPETARSGEAAFASDIWALGATLYAALEGRSPYEAGAGAQSTTAMLLRLVSEPPPAPLSAGPLAEIVAGMLDHDPTRRPDAAEVRQSLAGHAGVPLAPAAPGVIADRAAPARSAVDLTRALPPPAIGAGDSALAPARSAVALDFEATTLRVNTARTASPGAVPSYSSPVPPRLGAYEVGEFIGRGSSGEVHQGTRLSDGEAVAIKILRPELTDDPEVVARFVHERALLCDISHPNLVRVQDLVVEGGRAAIVMDLVVGSDLRAVLEEHGPFAPGEAVGIVIDLLRALGTVHRAGVMHRDVKAENVLVGADGAVALADFGIARFIHSRTLSRRSGIIGTPEYLAPELADYEEPTSAADVYAAGILLYELLTGFTPFGGGHPLAVLRRHVDTPPARPDGLPDELWAVLARLLAKDPTARPTAEQAAAELLALAPVLTGLPAAVASPPVRDRLSSHPAEGAHAGVSSWPNDSYPDRRTFSIGEALAGGVLPSAQPIPSRRHQSRGRLAAIAGAVVVVLAAAAVVAIRPWSGSSSTPAPAIFAFTPQSYSSGLVVNRTWTISGKSGTQLQGLTVIANSTSKTLDTSYAEVVPKSVAANVSGLTLTPKPDSVINPDPIVGYKVHLAAQQTMTIGYNAVLAKSDDDWASRVATLAYDQTIAEAAYLRTSNTPAPTTLAKLSVTPAALTLKVGQIASLTVAGTMSDGAKASALLLTGVAWSTSSAKVATVTRGVVVAASAGTAAIKAQAGKLNAAVAVTVAKPASAVGAPAVRTTSAAAPGRTGGGSVPIRTVTAAGPTHTVSRPTTARTTRAPTVTRTHTAPGHSSSPPTSTPPSSDPPTTTTPPDPPPTTTTPPPDPGPPPVPAITSAGITNDGPCAITNTDDPLPTPCEIDASFSLDASDVAITSIEYWTDTAQNPNTVAGVDGCTTADGGCSLGSITPGDLGASDLGPVVGDFAAKYVDVTVGSPTCVWVTATFADGSTTTSDQQCNTW